MWQDARGDDPVNVGNPVMEIKLTALVASVEVNMMFKVTAADTTLLLMETVAASEVSIHTNNKSTQNIEDNMFIILGQKCSSP